MARKHSQKAITPFIFVFSFLFFLGCLYLPLGSLFLKVPLGLENISWENLRSVLEISFTQAFVSAFVSGVLGVLLSIIFLDSRLKLSKVLWPLSLICFSLPVIVVCLALVSFWGRNGWVGRYFPNLELYGWFGVVTAHVFMNFGVFLRSSVEAMSQDGRLLEKAALNLGASRLQTFKLVTFPKLRAGLRTSFVLVFIYCFTSFLAVLLLGGGPKFTTFEVLIYQAVRVEFDLPLAICLATFQACFCAFLFSLFRKKEMVSSSERSLFYPVYFARTFPGKLLGFAFLLAFLGWVMGPLASVVSDGIFSFREVLGSELLRVTARGLALALSVSGTALGVGGLTALLLLKTKNRWVKALFGTTTALPLIFSSLLLSMALFQIYGGFPLFQQTLLGPFLIQVLLCVPVVVSYFQWGFKRIRPEILLAAQSLGAGPVKRFLWIELPLLKGALRLGFALCLCLSLGEVSSLLLFAVGGEGVLPLWIYRQMGRYQFELASGGSLVLLLVYVGLFYIVGREEKR